MLRLLIFITDAIDAAQSRWGIYVDKIDEVPVVNTGEAGDGSPTETRSLIEVRHPGHPYPGDRGTLEVWIGRWHFIVSDRKSEGKMPRTVLGPAE